MVAMGTNIIRDVSYGFPTAVNVVLYITPKINAIVSDNKYNTYVADTLDIISEAPNQLPTTSIPFTKKYVKSYPIAYNSNTSTNNYNVNVYDIISHVNQFRASGQCINNINTWIDDTASYTNKSTDLHLTPLNIEALNNIKDLFNMSADDTNSAIPQNPAQLNMYVSLSKPIRVTIDAANNEVSQFNHLGNISGTTLSVTL